MIKIQSLKPGPLSSPRHNNIASKHFPIQIPHSPLIQLSELSSSNTCPSFRPMTHEHYENPLIRRYASADMSRLWGDQKRFSTWRQLWVWLAEAEAELGLQITK